MKKDKQKSVILGKVIANSLKTLNSGSMLYNTLTYYLLTTKSYGNESLLHKIFFETSDRTLTKIMCSLFF